MSENVIPINALFDESGVAPNRAVLPTPHAPLFDAELIIARDVMTQREFLVYGRDALEAIVDTCNAADLSRVIVEIDQETDDLERLTALVEVLRGQHDFDGEELWPTDAS